MASTSDCWFGLVPIAVPDASSFAASMVMVFGVVPSVTVNVADLPSVRSVFAAIVPATVVEGALNRPI